MKSVEVFHYDAFSKEPNRGNPAGIVLRIIEFNPSVEIVTLLVQRIL